MSSNEHNTSDSLDVIDGLNMNMNHVAQDLLVPIYNSKYGDFFSSMFFDVPLAQWIAAILVFLLFMGFRGLFTYIIMGTLQKLAKLSNNYYDDRIISALKAPVRFAFVVVAIHLFFLIIFKETPTIKNILNTLIVYDTFWAILAVIEALREFSHKFAAKFSSDLSQEVGNFILTMLKIIISGIGLGAMLQVWGINVTALIASLGIGGLAFAFAAKDTAANLFGSFSLLADKSIRIGEWIKVNGVEGTVEDIGMRTTKVRSFGKSLITVPNQIVANNPIENFSRRGVRRVKMNVGLTYSTSSTQIIKIVEEIKYMLHNHKDISQKETLLVNFNSFGDSALNIFIYTFTSTSNWEKYLSIRENIHLEIMKIVEDNGSSFAFPSQSIYVEQMPSENVL
ncbi:MAG: mechanosensitive ion channel family protein [Sulfurovum sp.]|nr:mechanosensitive ion channel family protein [Sulfurovum sp.]